MLKIKLVDLSKLRTVKAKDIPIVGKEILYTFNQNLLCHHEQKNGGITRSSRFNEVKENVE